MQPLPSRFAPPRIAAACLRGALSALLATAASGAVKAQPVPAEAAWPSKNIHFVVPFAPGGPTDVVARLVGQKLGEMNGQQVLIENRSGAGGNIGTAAAARAAPDGYTILVTVSSLVVNMSLYKDPGYDALRDFIPVVVAARQPEILVVNPGIPAGDLAQFIAYAKTARPAFATSGSGTPSHLNAENLFNALSKLNMAAVHFRSAAPAVAAVLAGDPPVAVVGLVAPLPLVLAGKLRALAVTGERRIPALPDVPTLAEAGFPGAGDYVWVGLFLPAKAPPALVGRVNESVNRALKTEDLRARLAAQGFETVGGTQAETAAFLEAELAKWTKVVRDIGAKAD